MKIKNKINSDNAFMGPTHALSAVAMFLVLANLFYKNMTAFTKGNISMFIIALIVCVGASLLPDFDNTKSTSISTLGIFGVCISKIMRAFSVLIYSLTRSGKDNVEANPHRGFWHTILAAFLVGFLVFITTSIKYIIHLGSFSLSMGFIVAFLIILVSFELMLSSLFKKQIQRFKSKTSGLFLLWVVGIFVTSALVLFVSKTSTYSWLAIPVLIGWITHILGDTLTTAGTPIFSPIPHKGYHWWVYRMPPHIKAGSSVEYSLFVPAFGIITFICALMLLLK